MLNDSNLDGAFAATDRHRGVQAQQGVLHAGADRRVLQPPHPQGLRQVRPRLQRRPDHLPEVPRVPGEARRSTAPLTQVFKANTVSRDYRSGFSQAYKVLYKEGRLSYLTEILDSAQEGTRSPYSGFPYLWVNG